MKRYLGRNCGRSADLWGSYGGLYWARIVVYFQLEAYSRTDGRDWMID